MKIGLLPTLLAVLTLAFLVACGGSTQGKWSDADKKQFKTEMDSISGQLDALGDKKAAFLECYLQKLETKYASFADANKDPNGCNMLSDECGKQVLGMGQ